MSRTGDNGSGESQPKGKVIDLRGHHAAEQILDELLAADRRSPDYHRLSGRAVAMGTPVLAAIVRRLDATRPTSLALLGRLVTTYPARGEVIHALARAVADRRNSDNRRLGATLVLTQYIGLPPVDDFLSTLKRPEHTIATALAFALAERAPDAGSQRDYIAALISQPLDLLYGVVGALATTPGEGAIDALRLLALQPDADLMQGAIEALASRPSPAARRALAMLEPNVPSELAQAVARLLRKQSFSGLKAGLLDPVDGACRAFLTPIDGQGRRIVRFEAPRTPGEPLTARLAVLVADTAGLAGASLLADDTGSIEVIPSHGVMLGVPPGTDTPPARVAAALPSVEAPFTYALQLLKEAVALNWQMGTPLPADYQLSLNLVWQYGRGVEDYRLPWQPAEEAPLRRLERERGLLDRPHFEGWALLTANVYQEAHELVANGITSPEHLSDESWRALLPAVMKLARSEFGIEKRALYSRRLRLMADWLYFADRQRDAELAASAAQTMRASPPETNQFALGLLQRGLAVALEHLTRDANGSGQTTR